MVAVRRDRTAIFFGISLLVAGLVAAWIAGGWMMKGRSTSVAPAHPPARDFRIVTNDHVSLAATFRPGSALPGPAVLLLHGVDASRESVADTASRLAELGYATLTIDFRGHGQSDLRPRTFGWHEARDAHAAFAWLKHRQRGGKVAVIGVSMGGAASLLGPDGPLPVDALILQAVYPDLRHAIHDRIAARLGKIAATLLEPLLSFQTLPRIGILPAAISPRRSLAAVSVPVMVIGGREDRSTPPDETMVMYDAVSGRRLLWMVPHGDHAAICALNTPEYVRHVVDFLSMTIGKPPRP